MKLKSFCRTKEMDQIEEAAYIMGENLFWLYI
jgi:hypothetical protein